MQLILSHKSDKELWDLLRKNNKAAFSVLYNRHIKSLLRFGLKLSTDQELVKDCLQELFTEFWKKRTTLPEVVQVKIYIFKALRYKLLRAVSNSNKSRMYNLDDLLKDLTTTQLIEHETSLERKRILKEQLKKLPERQREVIHLRYFQNLKNEEIAEVINVNYQSVSNLLYRALKNLKANYKHSKVFPSV